MFACVCVCVFRNAQLDTLQSGKEFDVLVIGGGVTGSGVALDSQLRGESIVMLAVKGHQYQTSIAM